MGGQYNVPTGDGDAKIQYNKQGEKRGKVSQHVLPTSLDYGDASTTLSYDLNKTNKGHIGDVLACEEEENKGTTLHTELVVLR